MEGDIEDIHFHRFFSFKKWQKKEENGSGKRRKRHNCLKNRWFLFVNYKGKSIEIIGRQRLFNKEILWIHILDTDIFTQVLAEELEDDGVSKNGLAYARFVAIATKIKQEIAEKHILAPY